jgi:hypothetical protein
MCHLVNSNLILTMPLPPLRLPNVCLLLTQVWSGLQRAVQPGADAALVDIARLRLRRLQDILYQDFSLLIGGADGTILASARGGEMEAEPFEVSNIVRATFDTGARYVRT